MLMSLLPALRAAWKTEYTGVLHKLLYVNIQEAFQEAVQEGKRIPFANYACLINGSGSGKSRMLKQLASLMFSIPINFRRPDNFTQQRMSIYHTHFFHSSCVRNEVVP